MPPHPKPPKTQPKPRKGLRARSAKQRATYAGSVNQEGRAAFVGRLLRERLQCEAGERRAVASMVRLDVVCDVRPEDVHEILARSAGGSILDEANCIVVCRRCHDWIGDNPKAALALGLRRSRYAGRNNAQG